MECLYYLWIKMHPHAAIKFCSRSFVWPSCPVNSITDHGIECIRHHKDSCVQINLLGFKTQWVTGAVPFLVMLCDYFRGAFQELNTTKYHLTMRRMLPHRNPLFIAEFCRFSKYCVRDTDLADIVQHRAKLQSTHLPGC